MATYMQALLWSLIVPYTLFTGSGGFVQK